MSLAAAAEDEAIAADQELVRTALLARGSGSALRGWRRELDPDGSLDVGFLEFCEAAKRWGTAVNVPRLFGVDSPDSLTLREVMPSEGASIERFREWMCSTFGGPGDMFMTLEDPVGADQLTKQAFLTGVAKHGFVASDAELADIFDLLDIDCSGTVAQGEIMFLELDEARRKGALLKANFNSKNQHKQMLTQMLTHAYREDAKLALPCTHRLAPRAWHSATIERLPALLCEKRKDRRHVIHRQTTQARAEFLQHLQRTYGSLIRAWRIDLDPNGRYALTKPMLSKYCRSINWPGTFSVLWKALDQNGDGVVAMEEMCTQSAAALACLRGWARRKFGSCSSIWDQRETVMMFSTCMRNGPWKSNKKMLTKAFVLVLRDLRWPAAQQRRTEALLSSALDVHGCGLVSRNDLEWLDKWEAPQWLSVEPDPGAWAELQALMMQAYGRPLRVWRLLLDMDDSNHVNYSEFEDACRRLKWQGNVAGAWRCLDVDVSGTITLHEFDHPTAKLLTLFKKWIEDWYGAVEFAFRSMDTDGSGSLTFSELRRACQQKKWPGDVRELFDCLDVEISPGKRTLSFKELSFLDSWVPDEEPPEHPEETEGPTRLGKTIDKHALQLPPPPLAPGQHGHGQLAATLGPGLSRSESCPSKLPSIPDAALHKTSPQLLKSTGHAWQSL